MVGLQGDSIFLHCNGAHNNYLKSDSCMCEACYRDYERGKCKVGVSKLVSTPSFVA